MPSQRGRLNVLQAGKTLVSNAGAAAVFSATESYDLECVGEIRSFYLELPQKEFADRFPHDRIPVAATIGTGRGLGRIAAEFCSMLASEGSALDADVRARLGDELMDVVALALDAGHRDEPSADQGERFSKSCMPSGCRVSGMTVRPLTRPGLSRMRGSPTSGAPTRSSNGTR